MDLGGGPKEPPPPPPWVQIFNFLVIIYFIFVIGLPFQNLRPPFSLISLTNLTQIATIQPKNNKNIHNSYCILAKKNYFTTKEPKKSCVIGEVKAKFFAITINWYKYQLTTASCVGGEKLSFPTNKIYVRLGGLNQNSIMSLMHGLKAIGEDLRNPLYFMPWA